MDDKYVAEFFEKFNKFWARESEKCPRCGEQVTSAKQVGRSVYAYPCKCRIGQGRLHKNWQKSDGE